MKQYYKVSYQRSNSVYCANIAHAESEEDVRRHYSNYEWCSVSEAFEYDVEEAKRKGMPIIEIEHEEVTEEVTEEAAKTRSEEEVTEEILDYFRENEDAFCACLEELDGYNGYIGDDRYYPMDELNDIYSGKDPQEILFRAFYGYDEDTCNTDSHGNREYGAFDPTRDYFTFNGYGNLVSSDYKDYSGFLDHYAVQAMLEHRKYIDSIEKESELSALFDELEAC